MKKQFFWSLLIVSLLLTGCGDSKLETEKAVLKNEIAKSVLENSNLISQIERLKQQTNNDAESNAELKSELNKLKDELSSVHDLQVKKSQLVQDKIQEFTNILTEAIGLYKSSQRDAAARLSVALYVYNVQKSLSSLSKYPADMAAEFKRNLTGNGWGSVVSDAVKAKEDAAKGELAFNYIYTNTKDLPQDFKDAFFRLKEIIDENRAMIYSLKEAVVDDDKVKQWKDNYSKVDDVYGSIVLELARVAN